MVAGLLIGLAGGLVKGLADKKQRSEEMAAENARLRQMQQRLDFDIAKTRASIAADFESLAQKTSLDYMQTLSFEEFANKDALVAKKIAPIYAERDRQLAALGGLQESDLDPQKRLGVSREELLGLPTAPDLSRTRVAALAAGDTRQLPLTAISDPLTGQSAVNPLALPGAVGGVKAQMQKAIRSGDSELSQALAAGPGRQAQAFTEAQAAVEKALPERTAAVAEEMVKKRDRSLGLTGQGPPKEEAPQGPREPTEGDVETAAGQPAAPVGESDVSVFAANLLAKDIGWKPGMKLTDSMKKQALEIADNFDKSNSLYQREIGQAIRGIVGRVQSPKEAAADVKGEVEIRKAYSQLAYQEFTTNRLSEAATQNLEEREGVVIKMNPVMVDDPISGEPVVQSLKAEVDDPETLYGSPTVLESWLNGHIDAAGLQTGPTGETVIPPHIAMTLRDVLVGQQISSNVARKLGKVMGSGGVERIVANPFRDVDRNGNLETGKGDYQQAERLGDIIELINRSLPQDLPGNQVKFPVNAPTPVEAVELFVDMARSSDPKLIKMTSAQAEQVAGQFLSYLYEKDAVKMTFDKNGDLVVDDPPFKAALREAAKQINPLIRRSSSFRAALDAVFTKDEADSVIGEAAKPMTREERKKFTFPFGAANF